MAKLTWLGDSDPEATDITQFGVNFPKGEAVEVKDKDIADKLSKNPMFSTDSKAEAVPADEPDAEELAARGEEGTERAALKTRLRELGVDVKGNPNVETLRNKLAEALR